jgi:MFS family permease
MALATITGVGMWSYAVVLPAVQAEFGVSRAWASLPYSAIMLGFGVGGVVMGKLTDRLGIFVPLLIGAVALALGYVATGLSQSLWQFTLAKGVLVGMLGASVAFGPLMVDVTRWFVARRGLAVGIVASGNYVAGTVWPPVVQYFVETAGWRATHIGIGLFCLVTMVPLAFLMRREPPAQPALPTAATVSHAPGAAPASQSVSPPTIMWLLLVAGFACCMAMSMPRCTWSPIAAISDTARRAGRRCCR